MLISSTVYADTLLFLILAGEDCDAEVVRNRFSTTKRIDSTATSPKTSIKDDTRSRHEFLIDLYLKKSSSFS